MGMGHFDRKFQTEWGVAHQPLLVLENSDCLCVWCQNIRTALFGFVKARVWRTTEGQNYDSQDYASIYVA